MREITAIIKMKVRVRYDSGVIEGYQALLDAMADDTFMIDDYSIEEFEEEPVRKDEMARAHEEAESNGGN